MEWDYRLSCWAVVGVTEMFLRAGLSLESPSITRSAQFSGVYSIPSLNPASPIAARDSLEDVAAWKIAASNSDWFQGEKLQPVSGVTRSAAQPHWRDTITGIRHKSASFTTNPQGSTRLGNTKISRNDRLPAGPLGDVSQEFSLLSIPSSAHVAFNFASSGPVPAMTSRADSPNRLACTFANAVGEAPGSSPGHLPG